MTSRPTTDDDRHKTHFNILLVEDNATDVLIVQSHMERFADFSLQVVEELSQALECLDAQSFDVILLDLNLPDTLGLEGLIKLQRHVLGIPIVILTCVDDQELGVMAVQRGAQDYLIKGVDNNRLARSIRYAIERTRAHDSESLTVNEQYLDVNRTQPYASNVSVMEGPRKTKQHEVFTERELQALRLLGKGCSNQEIADHLVVSLTTVKTHIGNILQKLSVSDRTNAVIEALRRGLI